MLLVIIDQIYLESILKLVVLPYMFYSDHFQIIKVSILTNNVGLECSVSPNNNKGIY